MRAGWQCRLSHPRMSVLSRTDALAFAFGFARKAFGLVWSNSDERPLRVHVVLDDPPPISFADADL